MSTGSDVSADVDQRHLGVGVSIARRWGRRGLAIGLLLMFASRLSWTEFEHRL